MARASFASREARLEVSRVRRGGGEGGSVIWAFWFLLALFVVSIAVVIGLVVVCSMYGRAYRWLMDEDGDA